MAAEQQLQSGRAGSTNAPLLATHLPPNNPMKRIAHTLLTLIVAASPAFAAELKFADVPNFFDDKPGW
jgi:hypothetical protein